MITISIGNATRGIETADAHWIIQQIQDRRKDGVSVCVIVRVRQGDLDLTLATIGCSGSGGGRRPLTHGEKGVVDLWMSRGLSEPDFAPGNMVAFLRQLSRAL